MQADPARWRFVTGSPAEIQRLTRAFAIHVERNGVLIDHTLATAVVGRDGRIVEIWRGNGWSSDEVLTAMREATSRTEWQASRRPRCRPSVDRTEPSMS